MSKLKISFSFILTLLFVGMFSVVAFAASSTGVKDGVQTTDTGKDNSYNTVDKSNVNQSGSGVGTNDGSTFNQVIKSDDMVKGTDGSHGTQRTHGEYMNNTNSCASCHQTHTGASAGLLFKDGEYATCTACHDGTLGFYNVMGVGSNSAGTFGGTHDGNMSAHLANGSVQLNAAPGGYLEATASGAIDREGEWKEEFTCANCHAPHGSYSSRLLHEDPNGMADTLIKDGGKKVENVPVLDSSTLTNFTTKDATADIKVEYEGKDKLTAGVEEKTYNFIVFRFKIGDALAPTNADYAAKGLQTGDVVLQLMKWDGSKYVNDTDPWMHEYEFDTNHKKHDVTAFYDGTTNWASTDPNWNGKPKEMFDTDQLKSGEVLGAGFAGVRLDETNYPGATGLTATVNTLKSGKIARGYVVKLVESAKDANNVTTTEITKLWMSGANGKGIAMSTWCASCHTDYLAESATTQAEEGKDPTATGTFDHAFRHNTVSDSYTCVRCHFAHGTDVTIMRDARGKTYQNILDDTTNYPFTGAADRTAAVKDYLLDKNPSSALKRYTNMAVCWGCHTSSHSGGTRNTDSYQYNPNPGIDTDRNGMTDY